MTKGIGASGASATGNINVSSPTDYGSRSVKAIGSQPGFTIEPHQTSPAPDQDPSPAEPLVQPGSMSRHDSQATGPAPGTHSSVDYPRPGEAPPSQAALSPANLKDCTLDNARNLTPEIKRSLLEGASIEDINSLLEGSRGTEGPEILETLVLGLRSEDGNLADKCLNALLGGVKPCRVKLENLNKLPDAAKIVLLRNASQDCLCGCLVPLSVFKGFLSVIVPENAALGEKCVNCFDSSIFKSDRYIS
jgi:hypothetical protein